MNTLPDFNASDLDSAAFRDFIRKYARPKAMEGWDREKTFLRGGEKCAAAPALRALLEKFAAEKDARWIGAAGKGLMNLGGHAADFARGMTGKGVTQRLAQPGGGAAIGAGQAATRGLRGLAAAPVATVERGLHMGRTLGRNIAGGFKGTPSTMGYFDSNISRMPGSPWERAALGGIGGGALGLTGAAAMSGRPGAPAAAPAPTATVYDPQGAAKAKAQLAAQKKSVPVKPVPTAPTAPTGAPAQPVAGPSAASQVMAGAPAMQAQAESAARAAQSAPGAAAPTASVAPAIASAQKVKIPPALPQGWNIADKTRLFKTGPRKHMSATFGGKQFAVDPRTGAMLEGGPGADTAFLDKTQGLYKTSAEARDILKWLLGSALIGAGARSSVSLYHNIAGKDPLSPGEHLYDPEIEIPVDVTPEQMAKYKALRSPKAKKIAAAWDNTLAALTMTGGGALGWSLAHAMIRRQKEQALDTRLKKLRGELARLSQPEIHAEGLGDEAIKQAAAEDFFHIAAERYQLHIKEAGASQKILELLGKAGTSAKGTWQGMDPMMKVLAAGGTGLAAAPLVPGVRHVAKGVGDTATGGALAGLKTIGHPIGYGAAATLGPVAALGALYALYKGYESAEKDDPQAAELKALREAVRQREIEERPYFKLTPRVLKEHSHAA